MPYSFLDGVGSKYFISKHDPDVNLYFKTVIDYFGLYCFSNWTWGKNVGNGVWNKYFISKHDPDVNSYNRTVIDYFGGQYGIVLPSKLHINFCFTSVNFGNFFGL